jgi:hypothetical protein
MSNKYSFEKVSLGNCSFLSNWTVPVPVELLKVYSFLLGLQNLLSPLYKLQKHHNKHRSIESVQWGSLTLIQYKLYSAL